MNKLFEKKELLTISGKEYDVSNIPVRRKFKSREIWDDLINSMEDNFNANTFNNMCDKEGIYLIHSEFRVLLKRMNFLRAIKNYIKNRTVTYRTIRSLNSEEYEKYQDWVFFTITGTKKKDLETTEKMQKQAIAVYQEMESLGISQEECTKSLLTFLRGQHGVTKQ